MTEWLDKIHQGDCLEVMRKMPTGSIDLIVTSPPYADARKDTYGGVSCDEYVEWFWPRAVEMNRILKPTGSLVINIKEKCKDGVRDPYVLNLILAMSQNWGFHWIEEYIWHKSNPMPGGWKNRFRDGWERLLHFTKEKDFKINQDAVKIPIGHVTKNRAKKLSKRDMTRNESATQSGFGVKRAYWEGKDYCSPSNVLEGAAVTHNTGHSAAFPEWLPKFFILLFSDAGDVVLDPFSGSGTTARVAKKCGRHYVGIELIQEYIDNSDIPTQGDIELV